MSKRDEIQENTENELIDIVTLLTDYLRVFRKMWKRVILLGITGAVFLYYKGNVSYYPMYTASATFTINVYKEQMTDSNSGYGFYDNAAAEQMAKTFPYILTSGVLRRKVATDMNMSYVPGSIQATVMENTNLLTISVRDSDAERAYQTLESVVKIYPEVSEVIIGKTNMEMLDETGVPKTPDNPKNLKGATVKGAMAGLSLGFLWVGLVMIRRKTIRREEDCPKLINRRCLGSVPQVHFKARSRKTENYLNIMDEDIDQNCAEAFRIIRNKVQRSARENNLKTILITSALAGEGKSTIAVNLALSFAQEGKKVALVDCDLRHPSDSAILNLEEKEGLSDYLKKKISFNECIMLGKDMGLDPMLKFLFIQGGKAVADGSHLLADENMQQVVEMLEQQMDFVILDSAPVGLLTDASVLAQFADGALFVVKKDFAHADYILEGMEHLAEGNVYMMGCVLNGDY